MTMTEFIMLAGAVICLCLVVAATVFAVALGLVAIHKYIIAHITTFFDSFTDHSKGGWF